MSDEHDLSDDEVRAMWDEGKPVPVSSVRLIDYSQNAATQQETDHA